MGPARDYWDDAAAELATLDALAGAGLPVEVREFIRPGHRAWIASTPIGPVQYDGQWPGQLPETDPDYGRSSPRGYGRTRVAALCDLRRCLARITYGVIGRTDMTAGRPTVRHAEVTWDGQRITVLDAEPARR